MEGMQLCALQSSSLTLRYSAINATYSFSALQISWAIVLIFNPFDKCLPSEHTPQFVVVCTYAPSVHPSWQHPRHCCHDNVYVQWISWGPQFSNALTSHQAWPVSVQQGAQQSRTHSLSWDTPPGWGCASAVQCGVRASVLQLGLPPPCSQHVIEGVLTYTGPETCNSNTALNTHPWHQCFLF